MARIDSIPSEARWMMASRSISALTTAYEMALENMPGEMSEEISRSIWRARGSDAKVYASAFAMPLKSTRDVAEAFGSISQVFYGPEYEWQLMRSADDVAVLFMLRCPLLNRLREMGGDTERACTSCKAFAEAAVEGLNPAYTLSFRQGMCLGDEHCQMNIERKRA
ncbi:MAG TPA: hypothetical protein VE134_06710 [Methanomicrobiales archaeon]|nr:hypothetical protein [Methanomicrobiales archaeon]